MNQVYTDLEGKTPSRFNAFVEDLNYSIFIPSYNVYIKAKTLPDLVDALNEQVVKKNIPITIKYIKENESDN